MPRWEVHLSVVSMAFLVIFTGGVMGVLQGGTDPEELKRTLPLFSSVLLGGMAMLVGSVLPDIDGKGRIRWTVGPLTGAFAVVPPLVGTFSGSGIMEGLSFLYEEGARLFLLFTVMGFSLLLVPMKHRGAMHSLLPAVLFGTSWGAYTLFSCSPGIQWALLSGSLGTLGYLWHLSLDGRLRI